jgi:hypothetical protein
MMMKKDYVGVPMCLNQVGLVQVEPGKGSQNNCLFRFIKVHLINLCQSNLFSNATLPQIIIVREIFIFLL